LVVNSETISGSFTAGSISEIIKIGEIGEIGVIDK
jgi:hypothetical protein